MKRWLLLLIVLLGAVQCSRKVDFEPPEISSVCKPWTYWWWMGSAVDEANLTLRLKQFADAGFGGVHIVPIYGAVGWEDRYIPFLSRRWMKMLAHTVKTANQLGLGVDMSTGTGWPFGGPQVDTLHAAKVMQLQGYRLEGGQRLTEPIILMNKRFRKYARLEKLLAVNDRLEQINLTALVDSSAKLNWVAPEGGWMIIAMFTSLTGQRVKRAAPGGEGLVMDYFSREALDRYLARFDSAFARYRGKSIRAMYNDSYEVYHANWTNDLPAEFKKRRGYDLLSYLWVFAGLTSADTVARLKCDYRETISDLLLDNFTRPWVKWSHKNGCLTRNQAHGSPANLLDLYAVADVPETEIFGPSGFPIPGLRTDPDFPTGRNSLPDPLMMKFASSAAHVTGKALISSETCTWLGEHFRVALSQVKPEIDQLFVGGINHIFYHGVAYSPADIPWPGWLFYASTNFGPSNAFWYDLPALNAYIARCQSCLQTGIPDNDILLYWPVYDLWHNADGWLMQFTVHNLDEWLYNTPFYSVASRLSEQGYGFDYISDRQILQAGVRDGDIQLPGGRYKTILIPACEIMPLSTLRQLKLLAEQGAHILFLNDLPRDVPGLDNLSARRKKLLHIRQQVLDGRENDFQLLDVAMGTGTWVISEFLESLLKTVPVISRESMVEKELRFIRRRYENGYLYFITNVSAQPVADWVKLGRPAIDVVIIDPLLHRYGRLKPHHTRDGSCHIFLQLQPGESRILWTHDSSQFNMELWPIMVPAGEAVPLSGRWHVSFIDGGPDLPDTFQAEQPGAWTSQSDSAVQRFAGTARYKLTFQAPNIIADDWLLDLGDVRESARVRVNGQEVGTLFSIPFQVAVGQYILPGQNILEIDVTNVSANRIRDLDRRGVVWRRFHDINFVDINYEPFDASDWPLMPSGLVGPVTLTPLKAISY